MISALPSNVGIRYSYFQQWSYHRYQIYTGKINAMKETNAHLNFH